MKYCLLSLLCFFIMSANAQDTFIKEHQDYFELPRESIFIHTNKSIFTSNEHLWLKGYAIDRTTGKLSDKIRNVQLFVYDSIGGLIDKSMVLADQGVFFNQIEIDSTYSPGRYYLKALTNYMNNFKESDAYLQKFEVVDEIKQINQTAKDIEVIIRPEGQEIVYGLNTNLGFRITNDLGKPEQSNLTMFEDDKPIWEIKSSTSGLAEINFKPLENKDYKLKVVTSGGFEKLIPIENIKSKGTSIILNEVKENLNLNIESSDFKKNEVWQLVIFQENNISTIDIKMDSSKKSITLKKDELLDGLNTILVLRNDKPVLERLYYNVTSDKREFKGDYKIRQIAEKDSIILDLGFENDTKLMLSASLLPKENISYKSQQSIIKTLRIKPHVTTGDYNSLFRSSDLSSDNELDLLLLMSKSRYTTNLTSSQPPKERYKRKNGFRQTLYLIDKIKKSDKLIVGLGSEFDKEIALDIDTSRVFFFQNRYPVIGEELKFSMITEKRKFTSPKLTLKTDVVFNDSHPIKLDELDTSPFEKGVGLSNSKIISNFKNTNELDEVIVNTKKVKEKEKPTYGTKDEVTVDLYERYFKLSVYLRSRGFNVFDRDGAFGVNNYFATSINGGSGVTFVLDGIRVQDVSFLSNVLLDQFESITINRYGFSEGFFGTNGVIKLESRRTPLYPQDAVNPFTVVNVEKGYQPAKPYKNPNYVFYDNEMFKSLGTIGWFPSMIIENDDSGKNRIKLKVVDTGLEEAILYVEGISEDGQLHSYSVPINLQIQNQMIKIAKAFQK